MFKATNPENEAIIERLSGALDGLSMGATVTYPQLEKLTGWRTSAYWLLQKARERTEKNLGCAFECVRGVGVKRLNSTDIPDIGLSALRGIRRKANKGKKRLDRVNTNSLGETERRGIIGMSAMLGAVSMVSDGRRAKTIAAVADPTKPIPPKNIIDMFRTSEQT